MRLQVATALWLFAIFMTPHVAFGWGDTGHQIVCEIAFDELNSKARKEVRRLIKQDDEFDTFSESCVWPDHPRKRRNEHFINEPRNVAVITSATCPAESNPCLFTAIETDKAVLANPHASDADKLASLKFLGHWVGDIHQPLHISFEDDRGGNEIRVKELCSANLHSAWDTCLIQKDLGTDPAKAATKLETKISPAERATWQASDMSKWADESFQIARSSAANYCVQKQGACWYTVSNEELDPGEKQKVVSVTNSYATAESKVLEGQLERAGVRLAKLLNETLGH